MALRFQRLTRPALRVLPPGERITEHGIIAERQPNGDIRFSVNVMCDGQRIHRVIGRESEGVTREQAERAIESFRTKAREGRLDLPAGRKVHRTFAEAATEYLKRLEETLGEGQKGFADLPNKRRHIDRLSPFFGSHRLDKISGFLVQHFTRQRLNEGAKLASVNRELSTLSHMLNRAVEWRWIKDSERPDIHKGDEPRKKIRILTPAHAEALYRGAVNDQDTDLWLFVAIGLNTAMRHSEIMRIRWRDIDTEQRRIYVPQAKAGQREQPITASLADMLRRTREQRTDADWLFPATRRDSKTPHRRDMERQFKRAAIRAGLDPVKVTPHVMRHTGITRLVEARVDLPTIQRISGHKTLAMVMRYVHLSGEHIDTAIEAINTGFLDTITPELHTGPASLIGGEAKVVAISGAKSKR